MSISEMPVYREADGEAMSPERSQRTHQFAAELLDGTVFARHAASSQSAAQMAMQRGRGFCTTTRDYAHFVTTVGKLAAQGDGCAQIAHAVLVKTPMYQTPQEMRAAAFREAAGCVRSGYDDVQRKAGPEPGRPSSWRRDFNLTELLVVFVHLVEATKGGDGGVPTIGWCAQALCRTHGVQTEVTR